MNFVIDACSAILLAKATLLETVFETYDIQITKQAYEEVAEGKKEMFADALLIERLNREKKIRFTEANTAVVRKFMQDFNMGEGEAATIAAAVKEKKGAITDNNQGRKAAQISNIGLAGSVEIVVDLFKKKRIGKEKAKGALHALKREGWFDAHLIEKALEDVK